MAELLEEDIDLANDDEPVERQSEQADPTTDSVRRRVCSPGTDGSKSTKQAIDKAFVSIDMPAREFLVVVWLVRAPNAGPSRYQECPPRRGGRRARSQECALIDEQRAATSA